MKVGYLVLLLDLDRRHPLEERQCLRIGVDRKRNPVDDVPAESLRAFVGDLGHRLLLALKNADCDVRARPSVGGNGTAPSVLDLQGLVAEVFLDRALKLPDCEHTLHQTGRAYRMPASDQSSGGVHRALGWVGKLQAVVYPRHEGLPRDSERPALAVAAQSHVFIRLKLARGISIMELDEIQLL